jgi:MFS family permease
MMDASAAQGGNAATQRKAFENSLHDALHAAGYPTKADPADVNRPAVLSLLIVLFAYATMIYAPVAAALVEMFPTRIRYTAMSLPYHLANGWIGGLLPPVAFALIAAAGNIYFGLWYPIFWAAVSIIVLLLFYQERRNEDLVEQG